MTAHVTVRPETASDAPSVREVVLAAFPDVDEADLVDALRADEEAWIDGLSWVAVDAAGHLVGHSLLTRCHIGTASALCLAPCSVRPDRQREGVGTAVTAAALKAARRAGESLVVVLGHPDYYPRFGFERASTHGIRLSIEVPDESLMVLRLDPGARIPPGLVRYPRAFGI
ncbi:GNAT family N-acetyltransferase [Dietzia sp. UBA5065]|uniref:GNAT family N-acetyltransferase n=1 Tax=Dietzia sp. UBA5065 TaxID=1946422 RepID=UPI0025B7AAE3|nr:N-acetyltransferase [Dietzia sp. UBA5065]HMT49953.1 N-acetyltransferase [Dietzia sp.]